MHDLVSLIVVCSFIVAAIATIVLLKQLLGLSFWLAVVGGGPLSFVLVLGVMSLFAKKRRSK